MIVANTPAPPAAPAADVAPTTPGQPASVAQSATATDDFIELLSQLVTASTTAATPQAGTTFVVSQTTDTAEDGTDPSDVAALLPMAIPIQPLLLELPTDDAVQDTDAGGSIEALLGTIAKTEVANKNAAQILNTTLDADDQGTQVATDTQPTAPTVTFADALNNHRSVTVTVDSANQQAVNSPVGSPQWRDELGARISLMVQQGNHSASLRLSPEHLGPLEVRISVQNDQASVWFGAAHADTRAAIEHALPRLRELFASQGLSLADAGVFREPPRDQPKQSSFSPSARGEGSFDGPAVHSVVIRRLGLVDAYA